MRIYSRKQFVLGIVWLLVAALRLLLHPFGSGRIPTGKKNPLNKTDGFGRPFLHPFSAAAYTGIRALFRPNQGKRR